MLHFVDPSSDDSPPAPPLRSEKTMSIYSTKLKPLHLPGGDDEETYEKTTVIDEKGVPRRVKSVVQNQNRKKMSEAEVLQILRTIVTVGDPEYRYTDFKKIGQVKPHLIRWPFFLINLPR